MIHKRREEKKPKGIYKYQNFPYSIHSLLI